MTKTKRQLRAEAVGRLKKMLIKTPYGGYPFCRVMLGLTVEQERKMTSEERRQLLIDLLTDDEPPEGDAVAVLREAAHNVEDYHDAGEALRRLTDTTNVYYALDALADMVERDYVRMDVHVRGLAELTAERDEWKAKAERSSDGVKRSMTNLEWLYRANGEFHRIANVFAVGETDEDTDEWLMAEHVDGEISRSSVNEIGNGAQTSENLGLSQDSEIDTREKLEADIMRRATQFYEYEKYLPCMLPRTVFNWLDRQAAITERECIDRWDAKAALRIAELQAKVDELREKVRNQAGQLQATQNALHERNEGVLKRQWQAEVNELQAKLEAAERERDECADAADEAERKLRVIGKLAKEERK